MCKSRYPQSMILIPAGVLQKAPGDEKSPGAFSWDSNKIRPCQRSPERPPAYDEPAP